MGEQELTVINLGHAMTESQKQRVAELAGYENARVIYKKFHFDPQQPFDEQTLLLIESVGLTAEEWQTLPIVVNLPLFGPIAAAVLAILHGITGHFPTVLRLRSVEGSVAGQFEVAELLTLDQLRANGRAQR